MIFFFCSPEEDLYMNIPQQQQERPKKNVFDYKHWNYPEQKTQWDMDTWWKQSKTDDLRNRVHTEK